MRSQFEKQQTSGGEETRASYSQEEISAILDAAQARSSSDPAAALDTPYRGTIEDALEVARSLNIPEEHVQAAAREILARRRVGSVKQQKPAPGWAVAATGLLVGVGAIWFVRGGAFWSPTWLRLLVIGLAVAAVWALIKLALHGSSIPAEQLPVAGVCRVCGQPAYNERATFCEEHRYRGPEA